MKCGLLLVGFLLLSSCSLVSATTNATDAAKNQLTALEKSLASNCKTEGITEQIRAIKKQIDSIESNCIADIDKIQAQKEKWQILFFSLLILTGGLTFLKIKL